MKLRKTRQSISSLLWTWYWTCWSHERRVICWPAFQELCSLGFDTVFYQMLKKWSTIVPMDTVAYLARLMDPVFHVMWNCSCFVQKQNFLTSLLMNFTMYYTSISEDYYNCWAILCVETIESLKFRPMLKLLPSKGAVTFTSDYDE
jgi:hypothetical protein